MTLLVVESFFGVLARMGTYSFDDEDSETLNADRETEPEVTAPYAKGRSTSKAAADHVVRTGKVLSQAVKIYEKLLVEEMTCVEFEAFLERTSGRKVKHQSASARWNELEGAGCIVPTGEERGVGSVSRVFRADPNVPLSKHKEYVQTVRARSDAQARVRAAEEVILKAAQEWSEGEQGTTPDAARANAEKLFATIRAQVPFTRSS